MLRKLGIVGLVAIIVAVGFVSIAQHSEAGSGDVSVAGKRKTSDDGEISPTASAVPFISEVHPSGSGNGTYASDWFEITNTGTTALDITGWKMDDNSNLFANAVSLRGVTSIPPGRSAVFFEGLADGSTDAAKIAAFSTAWFGNPVPPAGFLIGAYGGAGVGLGTGGDSVNLYNAAGTLISNVTFGAATANATFDNTARVTNVVTLSSVGVNGAFLSSNSAETGSPGKRQNSTPITSVDLSTYVRVGRFDLPEPTRTTPPPGSLLAQEVSGVTYNWDTDTLFVVGDAGTSVVQVTKTGELIDSMTLAPGGSPQGSEFYDPEGITYVGNGVFVMTEERDRRAVRFTYVPDTTLTRAAAQTVTLGTFVQNIGLEGLTWDPTTNGYIFAKEIDPQGIFQTGIDFVAGTATNGSPTTVNSINLFDPASMNLLDIADVYAMSNIPTFTGPDASRLLVLSHESGKIVNVSRTGVVSNALTIVSDPGNPLTVPGQQHEGLTMDWNGTLYTVSENGGGNFDRPQLWVYRKSLVPNQAPTALTLSNQVNTLPENTSTTNRVKVADIVITDDGLGTNNLTVIGADAAKFEADSTGLYIKAGTILDFEVQSVYNIQVNVDDPTVGTTPDATASYTLTLTDVIVEVGPTLIISEVHPSGSGNGTYAADWFEVTNNGGTAVTITGWKMDDNSNVFANAVNLRGVTSIPAGKSAVFFEGTADGSTDAAIIAAFSTAWFGNPVPPAGLLIGGYGGSGVGLSTGGDSVNLFDAAGNRVTGVSFGSATAALTFDNRAGLGSITLPLPTVTTLSQVGVGGAFLAAGGAETGSPGTIGPLLTVSEVAPWGSGNAPYQADWFEITNKSTNTLDITGWRFDDSSGSFAASVALNGITSIAPGESVIFLETDNLAAVGASFRNAWFGPNPPAALRLGSYTGGGVGLSTGGDAVNIYNSTGVLQASVLFGASSAAAPFRSFDNSSGLNNVTISLLSSVGVNGAFAGAGDPTGIGSPGRSSGVLANNDAYSTNFATTLNVAAPQGVLANDVGNPISVIDYTNPAGGQVTLNADGSFNFVPNPGFSGPTTFTYTISDVAQTFKMNNPPLATLGGAVIGGDSFGSAIAPVPGTTDEYWGLTDRGPNVDNLSNGTKVEPIPNFNPALGRFKLINGVAVLQGSAVTLKGPNNEPYNGQVNTEASTGEIITDLNGNILPPSPFGYDPEGVVALADGTFWISDEYGPFITHFDATGRQIGRLSPFNNSLPRELSKRRPNRGMEGLTITPDGTKLVGMMQSPLINDITSAQTNTTTVLRIVTYTLANGQLREYLYLLDNPATNAGAVSEITAVTNTRFLVEERDGLFPPNAFKRIFEIDISGATDVGPLSTVPGAVYDANKGLLIGVNTLEKLVVAQNTATAAATLAASGITPVSKSLKLDVIAAMQALSPTSRVFAHDKVEGLAVLNGGNKLVISNDSDFGIVGLTSTTPPFQLLAKTVPSLGRVDFGEFIVLDLTRPIQTSTATVTITVGPPATTVQFSAASYINDESQVGDVPQQTVVTVTRTGVTTGVTTVTAGPGGTGTANVAATCAGNADIAAAPVVLTFAAGETSKTFNVTNCPDTLYEIDETRQFTLTAVTGGGVGAQGTTNVIVNDTANQFRNTTPIDLFQGTTSAPYPSNITVAGPPLNVHRVRVTLYDFYHSTPDNLKVLLVNPQGRKYILMGDAGGPVAITQNGHVTLTFTDLAGQVLPDSTALTRGKFEPTNWQTTINDFPAPAPAGPYAQPGSTVGGTVAQTLFGNFGQLDANGVWSLYIRDDNGGNAPEVLLGGVQGGWGLELLPATAAGVEISGRVLTPDGRGLRNATVQMVDSQGVVRTATTSSFGYYSFDGIEAGSSIVMSVESRRYRFAPRIIQVIDTLTDVDFQGRE